MNAAIECRGLTAGYRRTPVLSDITLTLGEGAMAAVLGPNGAGKTTLFRVLSGLVTASAGEVRLFGRDVRGLAPAERARALAVVPQELTTPMAFSVREVVALGRTAALRPWAPLTAADHRAVERAMAYTDVLELGERAFDELSGGERQRVAIALALAQEARLLLLDEPTSHLDINHRLDVLQLVERLNREEGLTVLMSSHDLNLAAEFFPHLLLLDHGRVVAQGSPSEVLREETLAEVYHCELSVRRDESGTLAVAPANRPARAAATGTVGRVHVICGGGSGTELLRRLCLAGWEVTCGALNEGDSDARAAEALELEAAREKPFSPLGAEALAYAGTLAEQADAVVVCEVPFGSGNAGNLAVAAQARKAGRPVFLNVRNAANRDYTAGREAGPAMDALLAAGATPWQHVGELLGELEALRTRRGGGAE